jgi:hypothetical protein
MKFFVCAAISFPVIQENASMLSKFLTLWKIQLHHTSSIPAESSSFPTLINIFLLKYPA